MGRRECRAVAVTPYISEVSSSYMAKTCFWYHAIFRVSSARISFRSVWYKISMPRIQREAAWVRQLPSPGTVTARKPSILRKISER